MSRVDSASAQTIASVYSFSKEPWEPIPDQKDVGRGFRAPGCSCRFRRRGTAVTVDSCLGRGLFAGAYKPGLAEPGSVASLHTNPARTILCIVDLRLATWLRSLKSRFLMRSCCHQGSVPRVHADETRVSNKINEQPTTRWKGRVGSISSPSTSRSEFFLEGQVSRLYRLVRS